MWCIPGIIAMMAINCMQYTNFARGPQKHQGRCSGIPLGPVVVLSRIILLTFLRVTQHLIGLSDGLLPAAAAAVRGRQANSLGHASVALAQQSSYPAVHSTPWQTHFTL
jgi:hypothetical protein